MSTRESLKSVFWGGQKPQFSEIVFHPSFLCMEFFSDFLNLLMILCTLHNEILEFFAVSPPETLGLVHQYLHKFFLNFVLERVPKQFHMGLRNYSHLIAQSAVTLQVFAFTHSWHQEQLKFSVLLKILKIQGLG